MIDSKADKHCVVVMGDDDIPFYVVVCDTIAQAYETHARYDSSRLLAYICGGLKFQAVKRKITEGENEL